MMGLTGTLSELNDAEAPYVSHFFISFCLINLGFLVALGIATLKLFRRVPAGLSLLATILLLELAYYFLISCLWLLPAPWGMSAAGATGIGNMGLAPQLYIAYPVTGLLFIWVLRAFNTFSSTTA